MYLLGAQCAIQNCSAPSTLESLVRPCLTAAAGDESLSSPASLHPSPALETCMTGRCWSGPPPAQVHGCPCCPTPMLHAQPPPVGQPTTVNKHIFLFHIDKKVSSRLGTHRYFMWTLEWSLINSIHLYWGYSMISPFSIPQYFPTPFPSFFILHLLWG